MASAYLAAMREVQPGGPYRLLGWSLGGCIAHAIACRLAAEGEVVSELVLLDTPTHPGPLAEPPTEAELEALLLAEIARQAGLSPGPGTETRDLNTTVRGRCAGDEHALPGDLLPDLVPRMPRSE